MKLTVADAPNAHTSQALECGRRSAGHSSSLKYGARESVARNLFNSLLTALRACACEIKSCHCTNVVRRSSEERTLDLREGTGTRQPWTAVRIAVR